MRHLFSIGLTFGLAISAISLLASCSLPDVGVEGNPCNDKGFCRKGLVCSPQQLCVKPADLPNEGGGTGKDSGHGNDKDTGHPADAGSDAGGDTGPMEDGGTDTGTDAGSDGGTDGGDPCVTSNPCQIAPDPECIDGTTLRSYQAAGSCVNGECINRPYDDTTCTFGCTVDRCDGPGSDGGTDAGNQDAGADTGDLDADIDAGTADTGSIDAGCLTEVDGVYCARMGFNCSENTGTDNCGNTRTNVNCGTCPNPQTCGAVLPGICGCAPNCTGKCGGDDQCGGTCSDNCVAPETCGGGGTQDMCGCVPPACPVCGPSPTGKGGDMCDVPAGPFWMGCNIAVDSECQSSENPYHQVTVPAFKIDKYAVTTIEYKACVDATVCPFAFNGGGCNQGIAGKEDHPINCINWTSARAYCWWAGKRLPSESEWEKATRGFDGRKYPWGNDSLDCDHAVWNGAACGNSGTATVGSKPKGVSPYGMLDAVGNVVNWVQDNTHPDYNGAPTNGSAWLDNPEGGNRVVRGAGFYINTTHRLRASSRNNNDQANAYDISGFRCAK
ncbi:MAG: SUMF1/EgtB/PvdO family nonheme iron enzyme [Deltaproteobacteria bacterium]|nr:SUMF1/EgtB/PvdO family nonheme iron enzyme [Deltaproteobacteria bacterium]